MENVTPVGVLIKNKPRSITGAGNKTKSAPMEQRVGNFDKLMVETCNHTDFYMGIAVIYLHRGTRFQMIDEIMMLSQLSIVFAQNPLTFLSR